MDLESYKQHINPLLRDYMTQKRQQYKGFLQEPLFDLVFSQIERIVLSDGKRVRPYFAHLAAERHGNTSLELALELFHVFGLIHDDMMDRSSSRRGVRTVHASVNEYYKNENRVGDIEHIANSQAVLAGDFVFTWVSELLLQAVHEGVSSQAIEFMQRMMDEVMFGQMLDTDSTTQQTQTEMQIMTKMYYKTASYTFIRPLQIGAALSGKERDVLEQYEIFGKHLGIAFQVQDDLLEVSDARDATGKDAWNDVRERQHTLLTYCIFQGDKADEFKKFFGSDFDKQADAQLYDLFESSGAIDFTKEIIEREFAVARDQLLKINCSSITKDALESIVSTLEKRSK